MAAGDHMQKFRRVAAWGALLVAPAVAAQGLPDPMRPPAGFVDPADTAGSPAPRAADPAPEAAPARPGLSLQSVLLPRDGRPVAVISGEYVPLGAEVNGWELVRVAEREVVIERAGVKRTLALTPLVTKTEVTSAAAKPEAAEGGAPMSDNKAGKPKKAKKPRKAS